MRRLQEDDERRRWKHRQKLDQQATTRRRPRRRRCRRASTRCRIRRNIVVVGAIISPATTPSGSGTTSSSISRGRHVPINARRDMVRRQGYKILLTRLMPDHVLVLVPAKFAVQVIRDAAKAGARSATIVTSGFDLRGRREPQLAIDLEEPSRNRPAGGPDTSATCLPAKGCSPTRRAPWCR